MRRWGVGARVISSAGVGLLLAAGMCGAGRIEDRGVHDGFPGTFDELGGITILAAVFVLVVGVVIALLEAIGERRGARRG